MAGVRGPKSNHQLIQQLQDLESLFASLSPSASSRNRKNLRSSNLAFQRGHMYDAYTALRESKLLRKVAENNVKTPPKKKVSFLDGGGVPTTSREMSVAQSVPDLSAALRKENKKPNSSSELTPPPSRSSKSGWRGAAGGTKSASVGEKKGMVRKSCASLKELKGFSAAAASAIADEGKAARNTKEVKKSILGHRQYG